MGTSFAHTLEMPAKMKVDGPLWMTFQHTLYPYFAYIGAPIELGAIIVASVLSFLLRRQPGFYPALIGAASLAIVFLFVWLGFTNPVNAETAKWTAESIPTDWARLRNHCADSHFTRFILHLMGFSALLVSFSAFGFRRFNSRKLAIAVFLRFAATMSGNSLHLYTFSSQKILHSILCAANSPLDCLLAYFLRS